MKSITLLPPMRECAKDLIVNNMTYNKAWVEPSDLKLTPNNFPARQVRPVGLLAEEPFKLQWTIKGA